MTRPYRNPTTHSIAWLQICGTSFSLSVISAVLTLSFTLLPVLVRYETGTWALLGSAILDSLVMYNARLGLGLCLQRLSRQMVSSFRSPRRQQLTHHTRPSPSHSMICPNTQDPYDSLCAEVHRSKAGSGDDVISGMPVVGLLSSLSFLYWYCSVSIAFYCFLKKCLFLIGSPFCSCRLSFWLFRIFECWLRQLFAPCGLSFQA